MMSKTKESGKEEHTHPRDSEKVLREGESSQGGGDEESKMRNTKKSSSIDETLNRPGSLQAKLE